MALRDWNNDGQKDFMDDFIEYNIYKEMEESFSKQSEEYVNNLKKSEPPTVEHLIELLKANAIVWSIVFVLYLINLAIDAL